MPIQKIKRKKGIAYRAFFNHRGQRVTKVFQRMVDAKSWLEQQDCLSAFGMQNKRISLEEACKSWLQNHSKLKKSPNSHKEDQFYIHQRILPFFGRVHIDEISPYMIEKYIAFLTASNPNAKPATINRNLQVLRTVLNYYVKRRLLQFNPVSQVGLLPEKSSAFDFFNFEEAKTFLKYASQKYSEDMRWVFTLYLLAINTGLRWGEIVALKWDSVDFQGKTLVVSRSYCKASKAIRETTKSGKARYVGINTALMPKLLELYELSDNSENLVFCNQGGNPLNLSNFKRDHFHKDLKEAGVKKIRFHDLRHTFASHFVMNGGNLYDLQKIMGHSNVKTTERYAHLSPETLIKRTQLVAIDEGDGGQVLSLPERMEEICTQNAHKAKLALGNIR